MKREVQSWRCLICILLTTSISAALGGCGAAPVKQAQSLAPIEVQPGQQAKPIQFRKIVVKLKRGEPIGSLSAGLACVRQGDRTWQGGRVTVTSEDFTEAFREELEKANYPVVGDPDALFEDPSEWKAEILVAGIVKKMETNMCFPNGGFGDWSSVIGGVFMRVDWQIYSRLDRKVVYTTSTEGSYQAKSMARDQQTTIFTNAFAGAVQNLLADRGFHEIVASSPGTVVTSAAQPIRLHTKGLLSQESIQKRISEIKPAVVTIYAGSGFGSGFFIAEEGYVLTNAHVVGDAKFVKVKLLSGREIVGEVIRSDRRRDVALVKTEESKMVALSIRPTEANVGEDVYAIGSPLDPAMSGTLTRGVLSGYRVIDGQKVIQSDVRVLPGNSGGPLLDQNGSVIGMAVSGAAFGGVPVGLNYFVPIADAQRALSVE